MKRTILTLVVAISLPAAALPQAVVKVIARDSQGRLLGTGAGFFVTGDGHVVAGSHPLHGAETIEVKTVGGETYSVKAVLDEETSTELVRLAVELPEEREVAFLEVSETSPVRGETVVVGAEPSLKALVSAVRNIPGPGIIARIDAALPPEARGAPLVNARGEVVGVAMWPIPGEPGTAFGVSGETVLQLQPGPPVSVAEWSRASASRVSEAAEAKYREGLGWLLADQYRTALTNFEQALEENPRFAEAMFHVGFAKGRLGQDDEKIEAYREALRIRPDYAVVRYSLGVSYALRGEGRLAREEHRVLKTIAPHLAERLDILLHYMLHEEHEHPGDEPPAEPDSTPI